jgi:hypothetical protein
MEKMKQLVRVSKIKSLIINLGLLFFLSCNAQESEMKPKLTQQSSDSISLDIPKFFQGKKWKKYFADLQSSLNIRSLQDGADDWQVRLWIAHGIDDQKDSSQLIVVNKINDRLTGTLYTYVTGTHNALDTLSMPATTGRFAALFPKSGWKLFMDSLKKLEIASLPDYTRVKGYFLSTDSYGVTIELATKNTYRIYEYPDYERHVEKIPEAGKILKILKLIEDEFKIRVNY